MWMYTSWITLILATSVVESLSSVRMPASYTAMKGNIVVGYNLDLVHSTSFKGFNAMVHLEYVQDSKNTIHLSR